MASPESIKQGKARRRAILMFCKRYIKRHGYGPSQLEIALAVGLASKSTVAHHLETLQEDGLLAWTPGVYRSITLV